MQALQQGLRFIRTVLASHVALSHTAIGWSRICVNTRAIVTWLVWMGCVVEVVVVWCLCRVGEGVVRGQCRRRGVARRWPWRSGEGVVDGRYRRICGMRIGGVGL